MKALTTLLVVGMFLTTVALADDVDDVKAEMQRFFAALNTDNADGFIQHLIPEYSSFGPEGGLLHRSTSLEEQKTSRQAAIDAGQKLNLQLRHLEVKLYGNLTAVTTCYVVGTVTSQDGTST